MHLISTYAKAPDVKTNVRGFLLFRAFRIEKDGLLRAARNDILLTTHHSPLTFYRRRSVTKLKA